MATTSPAGAAARALPLPRRWGVRPLDVAALLVANGVFIVLMWVRHGGLDELGTPGGAVHGSGPADGPPRDLPRAHPARPDEPQPVAGRGVRHGSASRWRIAGSGSRPVWLIGAHGVLTTDRLRAGRRSDASSREAMTLADDASRTSCWRPPGFGLFVDGRRELDPRRPAPPVVRDVVRPPPRTPTWRSPSAFLHQLFVGADFMHDQLAAIYWIGLYVVTAALVAGLPVRPAARDVAAPPASGSPRSSARRRASSPSTSTGRDLDRLAVRSGQYFVLRFLTRDGWWRAHPYSISSAPERALAAVHGQGARRRQRARCAHLAGRDAGVRRGPVRHPHGRPPDATRRDADRRRHRDHPAAGAARGAPGGAGRADPDLSREPPERPRVSRTSSTRSPRLRGARVHYLVGSRRCGAGRLPAPRARRRRRWRASCRRSRARTSTCAVRQGLMRRGRRRARRARGARAARSTRSGSPTESSRSQGPLRPAQRPSSRRIRAVGRRTPRDTLGDQVRCRNAAPSPSG